MPLKYEDGAEFIGRIVAVEGQFRAVCYAQHDQLHSVLTESSEGRDCADQAEAEDWIERKAAARGFQKFKLQLPA